MREPDRASLDAPLVSVDDIVTGLRSLGLAAGDGVVVHSSLSRFGRVQGGAEAVILALERVLTPAGTLIMPSFNHGRPFRPDGPGYFGPHETPTINGAIPDTFWRRRDVWRSLNPTHPFAAWGADARRCVGSHHRTLTMGPRSPLGLLSAAGGYGLLLGVGYGSNTFHHVVEMATHAPCLGRRTEAYPIRLPDGRAVRGRTWGWRDGRCPYTDDQRYPSLMEAQGLHRQVRVGRALLTLFRLDDCYRVVAELLAHGMDGYPPCSGCSIRPRHGSHTVPSDWDDASDRLMPTSAAWEY